MYGNSIEEFCLHSITKNKKFQEQGTGKETEITATPLPHFLKFHKHTLDRDNILDSLFTYHKEDLLNHLSFVSLEICLYPYQISPLFPKPKRYVKQDFFNFFLPNNNCMPQTKNSTKGSK